MSDQFIGEIRMFPFPFAPRYWAACDGQTLGIAQNQALFSLLGTTYGGNGQNNFQLPNLQGRVPQHAQTFGQTGGAATHTLAANEIPAHTHVLNAVNGAGTTNIPNGAMIAASKIYAAAANTQLRPETVTSIGSGQAHENMQPYLAINFCIALMGVFPSRN